MARTQETIWDAHVHCYPRSVIEDPQTWARSRGESHWLQLVQEGPQGWADVDQLVRQMDADGVERVLLQGWYWENAATAIEQNQWHAAWIDRYPDRLMACANVHPDMPDPVQVLEQAREWGAIAVGECLPEVQHSTGWAHPGWGRILDWTDKNGFPLCLHVTEPAGHSYPGRVATPLDALVDLFESRPQQRWICAHWGGGLPFYSLNRRVRKALQNVWFDTAASPLLYDPRVWETGLHLAGPDRILFGSDFPLRLYPGREKTPTWRHLLAEVRASRLEAGERAALLGGNLRALLGQS